jgi:hypothetical protein
MPPQTRPRKSLLYKKEELVLFPPAKDFVLHIFLDCYTLPINLITHHCHFQVITYRFVPKQGKDS